MSKTGQAKIRRQRMRYVAADWAAGFVAFLLFNIYRYFLFDRGEAELHSLLSYVFSTKLLVETFLIPTVMLGIYWLSGYYNSPFGKSRLQEFVTTFSSALLGTALIYLVLLTNDPTGRRMINYEMIATLFGLECLLPYAARAWITSDALRRFRRHNWELRTLIVGNSESARETAAKLMTSDTRMAHLIVGFVEVPGETRAEDGEKVYSLEDVEEVCRSEFVDNIVIAPEKYDEGKVVELLYRLFPLDIPIKISPDTFSFVTSAIRLKDIYGEPFVDLTSPAITECSKNVKRVMDVVVSAFALLILSPVYLWLALMVKRSSAGPVFYSQERIGLKQKPFRIYKFRTMRTDAEKEGPQLSSDSDRRVTEAGRMMRKYRLDELPQFWNVLKGDMSIVGPRPERAYFIRQIVKKAPYYTLVYQVRPGITSWGMVKYGYASDVDQMVARTRYDLIYMANMSLLVDMKILIYTVRTIVTGKGV